MAGCQLDNPAFAWAEACLLWLASQAARYVQESTFQKLYKNTTKDWGGGTPPQQQQQQPFLLGGGTPSQQQQENRWQFPGNLIENH
jgi:hypothetical protein